MRPQRCTGFKQKGSWNGQVPRPILPPHKGLPSYLGRRPSKKLKRCLTTGYLRKVDGDILCVPGLVVAYLEAFDEANKKVCASRNIFKTEVIYYASPDETLDEESWQLGRVRQLAAWLTRLTRDSHWV